MATWFRVPLSGAALRLALVTAACLPALSLAQALRVEDRYAWFMPPASNTDQQGFVRVVNPGPLPAQVLIRGLDASGQRSPGEASVDLGPGQSRHFNSQDLENGNPGKGLVGALGDGDGDWSLVFSSDAPIEALAYLRTPDGFLTAMHDRADGDGVRWTVPMFNPAGNTNQVSLLRVVNTETRAVSIQLQGFDDAGQAGESSLSFTVPALSAVQWDAVDLEAGAVGRGLGGRLGDGEGKWRLELQADGRISVQSLLAAPDGNLTNLSTVARPSPGLPGQQTLWFFPNAGNLEQQGFVRIINRGEASGPVQVWGIDDAGQRSPGTASFTIGPRQSQQFNAQDLENGNPGKGLSGSLGDGSGDWRLVFSSALALDTMGLVRTVDGFLTTVHDVVPGEAIRRVVPVFNPAQNGNQVSVLRLVNPSAGPVAVRLDGQDENGGQGPAAPVTLQLAAGTAIELTAADLEAGNAGKGLSGALGNGVGKWTLVVSSAAPIQVMSLMRAPRGFLTNLSTRARAAGGDLMPRLGAAAVTRRQVSGLSPFPPGCEGTSQSGTTFVNSEVEPYLAVNPIDPDNLLGVWQQDRWSNGSARGQGVGSSVDGGANWNTGAMAYSRCGGGNAGNGGDYLRATDPWVSFGPTGIAHQMSLATRGGSFQPGSANAMLASRSLDGGATWSNAIALILDGASNFNDKNALTADPHDPDYVYAVWDRLAAAGGGPAIFARSINGGLSWQPVQEIFDPGPDSQTIGNVVAVLPDGRLLNLFTQLDPAPAAGFSGSVRVVRSADRGQSWGLPVTVAPLGSIGTFDPEGGTPIRDGFILAQIAVAPDGAVHVVWQDAGFSGGQRDGIAWSVSRDGGDTWSAPRQVNREPAVQAFQPSVFVLADGTLGITYYDLRSNTPAASLLADYWMVRTRDGVHWVEDRLSGPFDLSFAPNANGYFVGDYQGLVGTGDDFLSLHVIANANVSNRTDAWFARILPSTVPATALSPVPQTAKLDSPDWARKVGENIRRELQRRRQQNGPD